MNRTRSVALGLAAVAVLAGWRAGSWPSAPPPLPCGSERLGLGPDGTATCGGPRPLPGGQALTLGGRLDLQRASAEELALVPGINLALARRLVEARAAHGGAFPGWAAVDAVEGVGPARLERLEATCVLPVRDAGL